MERLSTTTTQILVDSPKIAGIDYKNGNYSTVVNLPYMRAITDVIHDDNLGAIEWDALGGRTTTVAMNHSASGG